VNPKGIAVIVGVAVVILLVVIFPVTPSVTPGIQDEPEINEGVDVSTTAEDAPALMESVTMENQSDITYYTNEQGVRYYIDENGLKHYELITNDTPTFGEG